MKIVLLKKGFILSSFFDLILFLNRNRLISTQELVNTIRQIQELSNQPIDTQVLDIIYQFDHNKDGFINADEISKVKINIIFN